MEKIVAKQYGRNIVIFIKGIKYSKKTIDNNEVKSISNKIELYNKKPSKAREDELINLLSPKKMEKEKKEAIKKGLKKSIKKETKKSSTTKIKKIEPEIDLIEEVRKAYGEGEINDEQIKSLQDLLKKAEQKKAEQEAPKATYAPRRGEY